MSHYLPSLSFLVYCLLLTIVSQCIPSHAEIDPSLHDWNISFTFTPPPGYSLVWSEEFDQRPAAASYWINYPLAPGAPFPPSSSPTEPFGPVQAPNPVYWSHDDCRGCGNHELELYIDGRNNSFLYDGYLWIVARNDSTRRGTSNKSPYTSARLTTSQRFNFTFGWFAASIIPPQGGQGIWPAFWLLGESIGDPDVEWPSCGEIDVYEQVGGWQGGESQSAIEHATFHWNRNGIHSATAEHASITNSIRQPLNRSLGTEQSIYWGHWNQTHIVLGLNQFPLTVLNYAELEQYSDSVAAAKATWNGTWPFFFIANLAIGGDWPGAPDASTPFPQALRIDWIRVWQRDENYPSNHSGDSGAPKWLWLAIGIASAVVLIPLVIVLLLRCKRARERRRPVDSLLHHDLISTSTDNYRLINP